MRRGSAAGRATAAGGMIARSRRRARAGRCSRPAARSARADHPRRVLRRLAPARPAPRWRGSRPSSSSRASRGIVTDFTIRGVATRAGARRVERRDDRRAGQAPGRQHRRHSIWSSGCSGDATGGDAAAPDVRRLDCDRRHGSAGGPRRSAVVITQSPCSFVITRATSRASTIVSPVLRSSRRPRGRARSGRSMRSVGQCRPSRRRTRPRIRQAEASTP